MRRRRSPRAQRSDAGMVSAELALATPALVAVVFGLVWLLSLGVCQGMVAQAAREGARAAARGESVAVVRAAAHHVAPGAVVHVRRCAGQVTVTASLSRNPPIAFLRPLRREIQAAATSWYESA